MKTGRATWVLHITGPVVSIVAILLAMASGSTLARRPPAQNASIAISPIPGESCGNFLERANEFNSGTIVATTDAKRTFAGGPATAGSVRFKRGQNVIVAASSEGTLCIASVNKFSTNGWVPRTYVRLFRSTVRPAESQWSGLWVKQNGTWLEINDIPFVGVQIVDGLACSARCVNFGFSGAPPLGRLASWRPSQKGSAPVARTRLFEAPSRRFAYQNRCTGLSPRSSCRATRVAPDIANSCRFYATLVAAVHRLIVSNEQGSCGGLGVNWSGMYYMVAPYPPYARMSRYFKQLGIKFSPIIEQMRRNARP